MGVSGLTTFMNCNPQLFTQCQLHDCSVVIDANNLCYYLYFLFRADVFLGGDYQFFYAKLVQWLEAFKKCHITPYFVFDGAYDPSESKLQTTMKRARERLNAARKHAHVDTHHAFGNRVLPLLALDTMRDVLTTLGYPHAHSDYEADPQVVALANHLQAPVLSQDSDFYIYDLPNGFVNFDMLDMGVKRCHKNKNIDLNGFNYLSCRMYLSDRFLQCFEDLDRSKLPLLAAIMGNDNVDYKTTAAFFNAVSLPKKIDSRLHLTATQKPILGLLSWLQRSTAEEAVEKIVTCIKGTLKSKTRQALLSSLSAYNGCSTSFINHLRLNRGATNGGSARNVTKEQVLKAKFGCVVPDWCRRQLQSGNFPPFFLNVLVNRRVFLLTQVEMFTQPSSYDCSQTLRQVLYGILVADDSAPAPTTRPTTNKRTMPKSYREETVQAIKSLKKSVPALCELHDSSEELNAVTNHDSLEVQRSDSDDNVDDEQTPANRRRVTEYGRRHTNFCCTYLEPVDRLATFGKLPGLTALVSLKRDSAADLLLEALLVDSEFLRHATPSPDWPLFLCALVFWLRTSATVSGFNVRRFVNALLITALNTSLTLAHKKSPRRKKSPDIINSDDAVSSRDSESPPKASQRHKVCSDVTKNHEWKFSKTATPNHDVSSKNKKCGIKSSEKLNQNHEECSDQSRNFDFKSSPSVSKSHEISYEESTKFQSKSSRNESQNDDMNSDKAIKSKSKSSKRANQNHEISSDESSKYGTESPRDVSSIFRALVSDSEACRDTLGHLAAKFQVAPAVDRSHPPNLRGIHWYAELQTCLMFASYLNRLLRCPLPAFRPASLLNSIFLYNVYADLGARSQPEQYLTELLGAESSFHVLLVHLRGAVVTAVAGDVLDDDGDDATYAASLVASREARYKKLKRRRGRGKR